MSIRTILVPFTNNCDTPAVRTAFAAARHLGAHVDGIYVEAIPQHVPMPPPHASVLRSGSFGVAVAPPDLVADAPTGHLMHQREQTAQATLQNFKILCRDAMVPFCELDSTGNIGNTGNGAHPLPSASFERQSGDLAEVVAARAYACDLVVSASSTVAKDGRTSRAANDNVLLTSGRPVLLAPIRPPEHLSDSVLVAWNDSPQCWHALSAAMPFLERAEHVTVYQVGTDVAGRITERKAADYLAWHGIDAEVVQAKPGPGSVADQLMSHCGERQIGLMVMGAYSHSPLRERLLGGVTVNVLSNVAATPVLMMN